MSTINIARHPTYLQNISCTLNILDITVDPLITEIVEPNPNEFDMDILFQHDGSPLSYPRQVSNYLGNIFPCR